MNKRPADEDGVCLFYLERKKRPCRMKKAEGMSYCPHHSHLGTDKDTKKGARIPCPLDSSHFCYESKLQKHLKKCNAREREKPEYFVENININGNADSEEKKLLPRPGSSVFQQKILLSLSEGHKKIGLNDVTDDELLSLIQKIKRLYIESSISVSENHSSHPVLQAEMEKSDDGFNNFKHMKQQSSLLSLMENHGMLSETSCFVEFGAGRGQLMYWVVQCVPEKEKCTFVLVDKSAQRHKSDNKFKGSNLKIERLRIDIQHLYLGKVNCIKTNIDKVIGVCKHLCGCATDLALKCLTNTLEVGEVNERKVRRALGLVMALCCHHRCVWNSYVGKEFLEKKGISEWDFKVMCCIASWATCGLRKTDSFKSDGKSSDENGQDPGHIDITVPDDALLNRYVKLNLKHEEREEIGQQCKRLIDCGRVEYLKKQGYKVKLVQYIDKSISLENVALIAEYKNS